MAAFASQFGAVPCFSLAWRQLQSSRWQSWAPVGSGAPHVAQFPAPSIWVRAFSSIFGRPAALPPTPRPRRRRHPIGQQRAGMSTARARASPRLWRVGRAHARGLSPSRRPPNTHCCGVGPSPPASGPRIGQPPLRPTPARRRPSPPGTPQRAVPPLRLPRAKSAVAAVCRAPPAPTTPQCAHPSWTRRPPPSAALSACTAVWIGGHGGVHATHARALVLDLGTPSSPRPRDDHLAPPPPPIPFLPWTSSRRYVSWRPSVPLPFARWGGGLCFWRVLLLVDTAPRSVTTWAPNRQPSTRCGWVSELPWMDDSRETGFFCCGLIYCSGGSSRPQVVALIMRTTCGL